MGAGQIGGIATLLDIDFQNAAGFVGTVAQPTEAHYLLYFLSQTFMFCQASLIEAHVAITIASCVFNEDYKFDVYGGTHSFVEHTGTSRKVNHVCIHKGYNHTARYLVADQVCSPNNLALVVLNSQYHLNEKEPGSQFTISRIRYGSLTNHEIVLNKDKNCVFYGWGSRRNAYLIPLLIHLHRVETTLLSEEKCLPMWDYGNKYLCLSSPVCQSETFGALCPDDLGSTLICGGFLRGIMASRLLDRPCGIGYLDLHKFLKFLTCGVDDAIDVLGHDDYVNYAGPMSTTESELIIVSTNATVPDRRDS